MDKGRKLELLNKFNLSREQREIFIILLEQIEDVESNKQDKLISGENIKTVNGNTLLGSGDVNTGIPVIQHHTSDTTLAINPNEYHVWDEIPSLTISCIAPEDTSIYNEYMFQFTSGTTPTDLTEIEGVHWVKEPDIQPNTIYQVSILHNVGIIYGASINQNVESGDEQL